jgi:hypothetical protein
MRGKGETRTAEYAGSGRATLATDKVMGKNYDVVYGFANTLPVAPLTFRCAATTSTMWCFASASRKTPRCFASDSAVTA